MCRTEEISHKRLLTVNGHRMFLLELILIFVLQFEGISGIQEFIYLYRRSGHDVTLSCGSLSSTNTKCSNIMWLYNRDPSSTSTVVLNGNIVERSARAARLSLNSDCSLVINNVTAEDFGRYTCRQERNHDKLVHLSVLTISPSTPDADPKRDGDVTLECSLWRYRDLGSCEHNSIRWVDETGTVLFGEGVGYEFLGQTNCVSYLKVKHQSGNNRRFTCQLVDQSKVLIEAEYTPVFTDGKGDDQTEKSVSDKTYIILGAVVGLLVVLVIIAAVLMKYRKRATVTADVPDVQKPNQHTIEPESNLTYATLSHASQRGSPKVKVKAEEDVTYSAVKTTVRTEADHDVSSIYSAVSKPK